MKKRTALFAACILSLAAAGAAVAAPRLPVLILDGESGGPYHDWKSITPILKKELDETGLFDVDVVTAPPAGEDFSNFSPDWRKYRAIIFNYDAPDERWPDSLKASFEQYMRDGGGLVSVHAADNAFPHWKAFNEMIGIGGWRGRTEASGPYWHYDGGKLVSSDAPGRAGSHGLRVPFQVTVRDPSNPIMKGLPQTWMHQGDELYATLRGPGGMTVLATAYSDPKNRGSGYDEPQLMVSHWGKGRIFHTTFGHDVVALSSVDGVVTFQRGVEWAATGKVSQRVPSSFPTAHTVSYRSDLASQDPKFAGGLNPLDPPFRPNGGVPGNVPPAMGGR